jgi:hypothetical protein
MPADLAQQIARFRPLLREGVEIVYASLRPDGHLDATIRLEDGREGNFLVVFLDRGDHDQESSLTLIVEQEGYTLPVVLEPPAKGNQCRRPITLPS